MTTLASPLGPSAIGLGGLRPTRACSELEWVLRKRRFLALHRRTTSASSSSEQQEVVYLFQHMLRCLGVHLLPSRYWRGLDQVALHCWLKSPQLSRAVLRPCCLGAGLLFPSPVGTHVVWLFGRSSSVLAFQRKSKAWSFLLSSRLPMSLLSYRGDAGCCGLLSDCSFPGQGLRHGRFTWARCSCIYKTSSIEGWRFVEKL